MEEDVTEAAPPFNIIEEDDVDDDFELDLDVFVNSIYIYIDIYIMLRKTRRNQLPLWSSGYDACPECERPWFDPRWW